MINPTNPESNVPEGIQNISFLAVDVRDATSFIIGDHTFVRSDIAQAQTNRKVREVLERVKELLADPNVDVYEYDDYIDKLIKEYQ